VPRCHLGLSHWVDKLAQLVKRVLLLSCNHLLRYRGDLQERGLSRYCVELLRQLGNVIPGQASYPLFRDLGRLVRQKAAIAAWIMK
jgi:hypothetical protein